jgi:hypothetical protein
MSILGPALLVHLVPIVGLIIGIVSIAISQRKHAERIQVDSTESIVGANSLAERKPWLNNGFLAGLVTGFAGGVGFWGPFVLNNLWNLLSPRTSSLGCIALFAGVVLAYIFSNMAKKAIVKRGFNSVGSGYSNNRIGRAMLVIDGLIGGIYLGAVFYVPLYIVVILLAR